MAKSVGRREALLSMGSVLAASAIAGCASSGRANAAPGGPPRARNTGTIASKNVPRTRWAYRASGVLRGLRYADGRTFVITLSGLTALDASTGRELWRIPLLTTDTESGDAIAGGIWYICGFNSSDGAYGLIAIDCATGSMRWKYTPPGDVALNSASSPLNGAVYATVYDRSVRQRQVWAIDMATRQIRWKSPCSQDDTAVYAPAGGTRVFTCDNAGYGFTAFDAASGKMVWQTQQACCLGSQGPTGNTLIAYNGTDVTGLDATSGTHLWQATPLPASDLITQVSASDDQMYFVWDGAKLRAFEAGNAGTEVWSAALNTGSPILSISTEFDDSDTMFIGAAYLYAVDTRTGGCRWRYPAPTSALPDMLDAPIAVGGGRCFVTPDRFGGNTIVALAVDS
jgi:outer membrane protein assembly factor BamB